MLSDRSIMNDDPDILVLLTTTRTEFEASTMAESLRHEGIPTEVFATVASTMQWEAAMTNPIRVMVRRRDLQAAGDLLRAIRAESVDIDWDEVNVGEAEEASEPPLGPPARRIGGLSPRMVTVRRIGMVLLVLAALTWFVPLAICALTLGAVLVFEGLRTFMLEKKQNARGARR
jgi:hypothetical protein